VPGSSASSGPLTAKQQTAACCAALALNSSVSSSFFTSGSSSCNNKCLGAHRRMHPRRHAYIHAQTHRICAHMYTQAPACACTLPHLTSPPRLCACLQLEEQLAQAAAHSAETAQALEHARAQLQDAEATGAVLRGRINEGSTEVARLREEVLGARRTAQVSRTKRGVGRGGRGRAAAAEAGCGGARILGWGGPQ